MYLEMKYDYIGICDCGKEMWDTTFAALQKESYRHLFSFCPKEFRGKKYSNPRVIVSRNFQEGDIDDSYKDVILTREQSVNDLNAAILGGFFGKIKA